MLLSSTVNRVPDHTSDAINERIRQKTRCNVARLAAATPREIEERLRELDAEWDIERALEANASLALLTSLALGSTVDRRWYALSGTIAAFLLQHAVQGWCPPMPVLRRMGFRTSYEIDEEHYAIKALRGDFDGLARPTAGEKEIEALERFEDEGGIVYDDPPVAHRDSLDRLMEAVRS